MYILSDDGTLVMVRPDTKSYIEIGRKKLFDGTDAWAPLAIADGLMLLRDSKTMLCVDI
jgi:outer membrane protein assembly factor BamB